MTPRCGLHLHTASDERDECRPGQRQCSTNSLCKPPAVPSACRNHKHYRAALTSYNIRRGRGRSGGSSGGLGGGSGAGETELQLQRRRIDARRKALRLKIGEVQLTRTVQRAARRRSGKPLVAVVVRTNDTASM